MRPKPDASEYYRKLKDNNAQHKAAEAQKAIREKLGMGDGNKILAKKTVK